MFLRKTSRFKDGKVHDYWSVAENSRAGRRVVRIARGEATAKRPLDIMGTILFKPYQDLGEGLFFDN